MSYVHVFNNTQTLFDDLRFPASAINPPGAASDPDYDTGSGGWLFDAGTTEVLYVIGQLPHRYKEGSTLYPHVHWEKTTSASGDVMWRLRYNWSRIGEVRTSLTTISGTSVVAATPDTDEADKHLITAFPDISGTSSQISDMLVMRLERVGGNASDTYGADARMIEFDIHYELDPGGSRQEFIK